MSDIVSKITKEGMDLLNEAHTNPAKSIVLSYMRIGSKPHGMDEEKIIAPVGKESAIKQTVIDKDKKIYRYIADFNDEIAEGADIYEIGLFAKKNPAEPDREILFAFLASKDRPLTRRFERENLIIRFQISYMNYSAESVKIEAQGEVADWEIYSTVLERLRRTEEELERVKGSFFGPFQPNAVGPDIKTIFDRLWALESVAAGNRYPKKEEIPKAQS